MTTAQYPFVPLPLDNPWELKLSCGCGWSHTETGATVAMNPHLARNMAVEALRRHNREDHGDSWEKLAKDLLAHAGYISGKPCGSDCGVCSRLEKLRGRAKRLGEVPR